MGRSRIYQDWSQDTLGVSLRVDPVIFTDTFTSFSPFPNTHNSGVRGPWLYSAGSRESGTRPRGKAGGWSGCRCWHEAEECAATRRGRGLRGRLQGAECGQALLSGHVPTQVQEGGDVILATGVPQRCVSPTPSLRGPSSRSSLRTSRREITSHREIVAADLPPRGQAS